MRVKSVELENWNKDRFHQRYAIRFEHNGIEWEKFLPLYRMDELSLRNLLNSVIDDTIARI